MSIEWFRTGRDFCEKDGVRGTFWECHGGSISKFLCDSDTCDGDCKEVPVDEPVRVLAHIETHLSQCPGLRAACVQKFDFSQMDHFPGTIVHYKNQQCSGEGTDIAKIHQKMSCDPALNSCTKEEEDRSFREFCGEFQPDLMDFDEEFHIVGQFVSSATQRAQLVFLGFVVLDLLLCYVMVH